MGKLKFAHTGEEVNLPDGSPIASTCEEAGVPFACTEGVCGTCVIIIKNGQENLTAPTQEEKDFLGANPTQERLACQCKLKHGEVEITF